MHLAAGLQFAQQRFQQRDVLRAAADENVKSLLVVFHQARKFKSYSVAGVCDPFAAEFLALIAADPSRGLGMMPMGASRKSGRSR